MITYESAAKSTIKRVFNRALVVIIVGHHLQHMGRLPRVAPSEAVSNTGLNVLADVPATWPALQSVVCAKLGT